MVRDRRDHHRRRYEVTVVTLDHEALAREHSQLFGAHEQRIVALERDMRDLKNIVRGIERSINRLGWMVAGTFGGVFLQLVLQVIQNRP